MKVAPRHPSALEGPTGFWGEPRRRTLIHAGQILLVENLRIRRQVLCEMLAREQFGCGVVEEPRAAVQLLSVGLYSGRGWMPELIMCNARIVGDAGLRALALLRERRPDVSVVLYSLFSTPRLRARMEEVEGALVLDQCFGLGELRAAALNMTTSRRRISRPAASG